MSEQSTEDNGQAKEQTKKQEPASFQAAVISLVNSTLGSGMLGIPLAYSKAGLVPAMILHVLMAIMSWGSFYFLTYASEATGVYSYGELGFVTFGHVGTLVNEISTFIYTFGPLWSYCIMVGDFLPDTLHGVGAADKWYTQRTFITILVAFFIIQPLSWLRTLNSLRYTSFFGMFSMMFCVLVIFIRYFAPAGTTDHHLVEVEAVHNSPSMIQTFSTLCFAFGCQQNVPLIQDEIYEKSTRKMNIIAVYSIAIVGVFYMIAGVFGYSTFGKQLTEFDDAGNILNMYKDDDYLVFVARIASLFTVIFACPMNSLPARVALLNIIDASRAIYREHKAHKETAQKDTELSEMAASEEGAHSPSSDETNEPDVDTADPDRSAADEQESSSESDSSTESDSQSALVEEELDELHSRPDWWYKNYACMTGELWVSCLIGTTMVLVATLLALFLSKLEFVFDFLGSTAGVAVAFLIPAAVYLRIIKHPEKYLNLERSPNTIRPRALKEFYERNERMKIPSVGFTPGCFWAWVVFALGIVFGAFALAMAIIYDTPLADHVDF